MNYSRVTSTSSQDNYKIITSTSSQDNYKIITSLSHQSDFEPLIQKLMHCEYPLLMNEAIGAENLKLILYLMEKRINILGNTLSNDQLEKALKMNLIPNDDKFFLMHDASINCNLEREIIIFHYLNLDDQPLHVVVDLIKKFKSYGKYPDIVKTLEEKQNQKIDALIEQYGEITVKSLSEELKKKKMNDALLSLIELIEV
jgi:hypothetical protein